MDADAVKEPGGPETDMSTPESPKQARAALLRQALRYPLLLALAGWAVLATLFYMLRFGFLAHAGGAAGFLDLMR
ncbi:MAG: hypothetical protein GX580_15390 [Candidatus Hydrogenedens sp.]|nr:hypothetical protein [Candidatus Hydrogenedentota bacterium]NLF59013.1 hypothetical protein [Candidatus Hydrogenedens sp.]